MKAEQISVFTKMFPDSNTGPLNEMSESKSSPKGSNAYLERMESVS